MSEQQQIDFNNNFAPWQNSAAFNAFWSYSYVNNSGFYTKINGTFRPFMQRFVQNWLWWYDGWVPYFHNADAGIMSTRIASALVDRTARKISGGRIAFKNAFDEDPKQKGAVVNKTLAKISKWAADTNFSKTVKNAIKYAEAAGTALVKVNKGVDGVLNTEAVRFDRFLPCVNSNGRLEDVSIFLLLNIDIGETTHDKQKIVYTLNEHRYFGDYTAVDGKKEANVPLVEYEVHKYYGQINNGLYASGSSEKMRWLDLPREVKKIIADNYAFAINRPIKLHFVNSLGCEIVTATDGVGNLPELPFGESLLSKILPYLQAWDYYFSAFCTDMYTGRARVLIPKGMSSAKSGNVANSGLDSYLYEGMPHTDPDKQAPLPLQFSLRAAEWKDIRNMLIENIAVNTGLSSTTVASFLNDNSAKTAREVSTEENETADFVDNSRAVVEVPLNRILKLVSLYMGLLDDVVIRWSTAGLTNKYVTAETLNMAIQGGYLSKFKAVRMFNSDDDDIQVQEEYERIKEDEQNAIGNASFPDDEQGGGYFGEEVTDDNEEAEPTSDTD